MLPVASGRITAVFGPTSEPLDSGYAGYAHFNKGIDISVPVGTQVFAPASGVITLAADDGVGWGVRVVIRDATGHEHSLGHLSAALVAVGQHVSAGSPVALSGNTGASTGPHLSYDIKGPNGAFVSPSAFLGFNADGHNDSHPSLGRDVSELGSFEGGGGPMPDQAAKYWENRREYNSLSPKVAIWLDTPELAQSLGLAPPTPQEVSRFLELETQLNDFEDLYGPGGQAGMTPDEIRAAYENSDGVIDATNAANRYGREFDQRVQAAKEAADKLEEQQTRVETGLATQDAFTASRAPGGPQGGRTFGIVSTPDRLKSGDELFNESIAKLRDSLPDVPDLPYVRGNQAAGMGGYPPEPYLGPTRTTGLSSTPIGQADRTRLQIPGARRTGPAENPIGAGTGGTLQRGQGAALNSAITNIRGGLGRITGSLFGTRSDTRVNAADPNLPPWLGGRR